MPSRIRYLVFCDHCGIQELSVGNYLSQLSDPNVGWRCPNCGTDADWQGEYTRCTNANCDSWVEVGAECRACKPDSHPNLPHGWRDNLELAELRFRDRKMTRDEYVYWCRRQRSDDKLYRWSLPYEATLLHHIAFLSPSDDYSWTPCPEKFQYLPASTAYSNHLSNLICDYAGDMIDPEADAMRAYENMLTDAFHTRYPEE